MYICNFSGCLPSVGLVYNIASYAVWFKNFALVSICWSSIVCQIIFMTHRSFLVILSGAAVAEWLSSWLAEQEDRGSILGLATWIFRDWLSPASKSSYDWKIAKSTLILKTTRTNQVILTSHIGNLWQVQVNLHRLWPTNRCHLHRLTVAKMWIWNLMEVLIPWAKLSCYILIKYNVLKLCYMVNMRTRLHRSFVNLVEV